MADATRVAVSRPFRVLVVCTANMCRSPSAQLLLDDGLREVGLAPGTYAVASAGTRAMPGAHVCAITAAELAGPGIADARVSDHRARSVDAGEVAAADLVLTADRGHRAELARLAPAARTRTFTLVQAAQLADGLAATLTSGSLPDGAPPVPPADDVPGRLRWLVAELDAARGSAGSTDEHDLPDPHVVGTDQHPVVFARIAAAVDALTRCAAATVSARPSPTE